VTDHTSASPPRNARIGCPGLSSRSFGPERSALPFLWTIRAFYHLNLAI
jgi:hypothetical protein